MGYHPARHHRRSIRLKGYDYSSAGAYFITICVQGRECSLGEVQEGQMIPSTIGLIVQDHWDALPKRFPSIELDAFTLMPNHVHGILLLTEATPEERPKLSQVIAYWKYQTTKHINQDRESIGTKFWQRNYYEHIIRNPASLDRLRQYIMENPQKWDIDQLHPHLRSDG
ncbi:MAG: transposase [Prochlorotrichaceae cyanobacterium]|jgi:REP element-mobilizing transposase RayT